MKWGITRKHRISDGEAFRERTGKPSCLEFKTEGLVPRPRGKLVAEPGLVLRSPGSTSALGSSPFIQHDRGGEGGEKGVSGLRK